MNRWRIYIVLFLLFVFGAAIIGRLFSLQIIYGTYYKGLAGSQHRLEKIVENRRGEIFIRDKDELFPVAVNRKWPMVYLVPKDIGKEDIERVASELARILNLKKDFIFSKLGKSNDPYEPLTHRISDEEADQISKLNLPGVEIKNEDLRFYPLGGALAHVLGFVGFKGDKRMGQYGLEEFYEKELSGKAGRIITEKDAFGRIIGIAERFMNPATPSRDLILTIDKNIQFMAEDKLSFLVKKWEADSGSIIVMNPANGQIIAMANYPVFNPNEYYRVEDINIFLNPITHNLFEPGSVFKPITMAAALDDGKIAPETRYTDGGLLKIGGYTIQNSDRKSHGSQTMTEVLEKSLNTGAVFAVSLLDKDVFLKYVRRFGFDENTRIDLAGEVSGNISNLYFGRDINYATASFGQGIAITPIELITAISGIANQGAIMRPYIVAGFRDDSGKTTDIKPRKLEQVVSPESARKLTKMLVSAVDNGYSKSMKIAGYNIAGKTGTAQVPSEDKRGYGDETIHTIVGYAPAFNPRFTLMIKINNPKGARFADNSISPVFRQVIEFMLNYYGIAPDYTVENSK